MQNKNIDYVECEICGKQQKAIIKHVRLHNITPKEYKINFPNSKLECLNSKQLRANNRRETIRREYGVDNIS